MICRGSNRTRSTGSCVAALVSLILAPALLGGCAHATQAKEPAPPKQTAVRLPSTWPQRLAMADDGSLWITDEYHGVTRLEPDGRVREYTISEDGVAADIVDGADGAVWFAGIETVGRIDRTGKVETWRVDGFGLARAITAVDGTFWFTNEGAPGRIERLSAAGATTGFSVTGVRASFAMTGIAAGPDGALWFTQRGYGRDAPDGIGRMTTDGRYSSWPLPRRRAAPIRITAGPDGALWFTQQDAHAIGHITTTGAITGFPLRTGLSPYDITAGTDGALWFTADDCIGRITTSGHVTSWPVRNAGRLIGIAAASDGSFWLADEITSTVWHFTPPKEAASPAATCYPPAVTREAGSTQATLVYRRLDRFNHVDWFTDARVRISRGGRELFSEVVPRNPRGEPEYGVFGSAGGFAVRDIDGDGEPEVMLELNWNGTHCCDWSRIYRYDASRNTYVPGNHFWGNGSAAPKLKDLDRDGRSEFLSQDDRFAYDFDGYAGSVRPIQIWAYDRGVFHDVTRSHPDQIRRDTAEIWRLYLKYRGKRSVRGILPAWAADQYMLGRGDVVDRVLDEARTRGYLDCTSAEACVGEPRSADGYIGAVKRLLRKTGYIAG